MELTTQFECGNGKNIRRIATDEYVLETNGSDPTYSFYFYFRITGDDVARNLQITVLPDSDYAAHNPELFNDDRPSVLWIRRNDRFGWTRMNHHWAFRDGDSFEVEKKRYLIKLHVGPLAVIEVANMLPLPYSQMCDWLQSFVALLGERAEMQQIGQSEEGRAILGVRFPSAKKKPKLFIYAGEHATEFAGQWGVKGIMEFVSSGVAEAQAIRDKYELLFVPQVNPDGNVHGLLHNINKVNLHLDYAVVDGRCRPRSREAEAVWKLVGSYQPDMHMCLHTFIGPLASSDPPYEGLYVPPPSCFKNPKLAKVQQRINEYLKWYTDATYFWGRDELLKTASEDTALYRFAADHGVLGCTFEPNMSVGETACVRSSLKVLRALLAGFEQAEA
jgi:hypothetical protein